MMISFLKNNARKRSHAVVVLFEKTRRKMLEHAATVVQE